MHDLDMPRRITRLPSAPALPLTGLLLVARLKRKNGSRGLGRMLDKGLDDSMAASDPVEVTQPAVRTEPGREAPKNSVGVAPPAGGAGAQ